MGAESRARTLDVAVSKIRKGRPVPGSGRIGGDGHACMRVRVTANRSAGGHKTGNHPVTDLRK
ncbi:hypothetical protein FRAAL2857 [Frankia alni ACN14a]|uniref:Uncharacterized protein n=1 Tax=Frankia alni (strain DSM 45986 / CECT 9034 / ACN14a) TaxID=326424 RepID=Q0RLV3_FRAAA|nr:hypothetical protein FRAAL2857 [Frankia alni ACN14a]